MSLLYPESLALTLDALSAALFFQEKLKASEKREAAAWIAGRQGLPGSYAGMFAPTALDFEHGATLLTGERVKSGAGTAHILGQEACRVLRQLGPLPAPSAAALKRADAGITERLHASPEFALGRYCCGTCSVAAWRNAQSGGISGSEAFLRAGVATLSARRDGAGRWRGYPFHYTLLGLSEMQLPEALAELRYCAPVCERIANRKPAPDAAHALRRQELARRVLERC
jgi:hypothetical protein